MAEKFKAPRFQQVDASGNPIIGSLGFYITGTTTPIAVWSDRACSAALTNPVNADSNGRMPAVWIADAQLSDGVKVIYYAGANGAGATVWTDDPYEELQPYRRTAAEAAASVVPSNYAYPELDVRRYGAVLNGVTSDYSALNSAALVVAQKSRGGEVIVPDGDMAVDSAAMPVSLPSNITIRGAGIGKTRITVTGSGTANLFEALNKTNIAFKDLTLRGNNQGTTSNMGQAVVIQQTTAATAVGDGYRFIRCRFENFKGWYWIYCTNQSGTYRMRNVKVLDCEFLSETGNSQNAASLAVPAACMAFQGQGNGSVGLLTDVEVRGCWADCEHIKTFGVAWHSTLRVNFRHNTVINAGVTGAADNCAGYAFLAYDNSLGAGGAQPDFISWKNNNIISPRSAGIYVADANHVRAVGNEITGQTDTVDGTLPKGAIVYNAVRVGLAARNFTDGCYGGIVLYGNTAADRLYARDNEIINTRATGFGITAGTTFAGKALRFEITGNSVESSNATTRGVYLRFSATSGATHLIVKNNPCLMGVYSCIEVTNATDPDVAYADISDNTIVGNGTATGLYWNDCQDSESRVSICRNKFTGAWDSAGTALDVRKSYGLTLMDNEFCDLSGSATGYAIKTELARGRMQGNRWSGVADARRYEATGNEDLGYDTPTWTGVQGDFVQNMEPTDVTGATWDYQILGWQYTNTGWRAVYAPYQDS